MKIVDGVNLHVIKTAKFKTNHITLRFTGNQSKETVAKRVLTAQMLATANADYPTHRLFQQKLASLYGTRLSTKVSTKGKAHLVDIDIDFLRDDFTLKEENLLEEVFDILYGILYRPLISLEQFQSKTFDIEKANLLSYLKVDEEDSFYYSGLKLHSLYHQDEDLQISEYAEIKLIEKENSYTAYQEFQKMLKEDQIDIFVLGDIDGYSVIEQLNHFPFEKRQVYKFVNHQQNIVNIVKEEIEHRQNSQSVLQIAYHLPIANYQRDLCLAQLLNGMLGCFGHSRLFTEVREKAGLAYTISSELDRYTGLLQIYAGIDKSNREKTLHLINKQWHDFKLGRFSSQLMNQTKQLLISNAQLVQDCPKVLIERLYNSKVIQRKSFKLEDWIKTIDSLTKSDIICLAKASRLQAVYFLEGE
ncbi:EF-P 5-aminopentanol modification-associated protein YfmF [Streptococcus dentapri]|uniref:EF-P 5-aminopentanol modification-associated protein YfmF n=1 Tax=Streptococcus dentapri TaxID=573564 RepID=A0ABV8D2D9_9STRE